MPRRPLWTDKAPDPAAVAAHLEACALEAKGLRFTPEPPGDLAVLHQAALLWGRSRVQSRSGERDRLVAQEVRALDDLVRAANLLVERLREWYGLHAPEAVRLEEDAERLARLVAEHGERGAVLARLHAAEAAADSLGAELDPGDLEALRAFAASLAGLHDAWRTIEKRIRALMETTAPNVAAAVGPMLGARLIAHAGGLERLACMSAGTVQLLGAENALFRHLKDGSLPPKHGILFQHPAVHQAPLHQRGDAARVLSRAALLGARADAYTGADLSSHLEGLVGAGLERAAKRPAPPPRHRRAPQGAPRSGGPRTAPPARTPARPRSPPGGGQDRKPAGQRGAPGRAGPRKGGGKNKGPRRGGGAFRGGDGPARPPGRGDR